MQLLHYVILANIGVSKTEFLAMKTSKIGARLGDNQHRAFLIEGLVVYAELHYPLIIRKSFNIGDRKVTCSEIGL
jgi:hypothetical protein